MPEAEKKTCETCRFVTYMRLAEVGAKDIICENPELRQQPQGKPSEHFFLPPRLTFSCNRWLMRKPELGFPPDFVREEETPALSVASQGVREFGRLK